MHHELPGSFLEGCERQVRHSRRAHDGDARDDGDAVDRVRPQSQWHASETIVPSSACAASTVAKVDLELNGRLA